MPTNSPSSSSGGAPRPSLKWQLEQARALNVGPRPSRASVDDGACTQEWLNRLLPVKNIAWCASVMLSAGGVKALLPNSSVLVVSPPGSHSPSSTCGSPPQADTASTASRVGRSAL